MCCCSAPFLSFSCFANNAPVLGECERRMKRRITTTTKTEEKKLQRIRSGEGRRRLLITCCTRCCVPHRSVGSALIRVYFSLISSVCAASAVEFKVSIIRSRHFLFLRSNVECHQLNKKKTFFLLSIGIFPWPYDSVLFYYLFHVHAATWVVRRK